jgi:hypothetical protein
VIVAEQRDGKVTALLHGLAVLDLFGRDRTVVGVVDIAKNLGVHRSTASRLAATLASAGYLETAGEPGRYRLAPKLATLGELAAVGTDLRRAADGPLRDLVAQLGETAHLGVLEGTEAVTIDVVDGWQTVRMHSWVGKRSPAHCSSIGKALLAELSPARAPESGTGPGLRRGPRGTRGAPVLRGGPGHRPDRLGRRQHQHFRASLPFARPRRPHRRGQRRPGHGPADQRPPRSARDRAVRRRVLTAPALLTGPVGGRAHLAR